MDEIMKQWDRWRKYIAEGGTASWPRDAFENIISNYEKRINSLEEAIDKHKQFRRTHEWVVSLEDEELYQKRKEEGEFK